MSHCSQTLHVISVLTVLYDLCLVESPIWYDTLGSEASSESLGFVLEFMQIVAKVGWADGPGC